MADKKTAGEKLKEKLLYSSKSMFETLGDEEIDLAYSFCEPYKDFLNRGKTERASVRLLLGMAKDAGFKEFKYSERIKPGERFYQINRAKGILLGVMGSEPLSEGVNIVAAHIDSPRLDLKVRPLYEEGNIGWLKTHYYGGVRKYQWTALPLSLYGVVFKKDGTKVEIEIGDRPDDPVFSITDLLPHLAKEQSALPLGAAIKAENMNVILGSRPYPEKKLADKIKINLMNILNEAYGITEYDFLAADISLVPSFFARDVGLDRSMIGSYGHDDRSCAYTAAKAVLELSKPKHTCLCALVDREEIGSDGVTGMQSDFFMNVLRSLAVADKVDMGVVTMNSRCLSADVAAAFDPNYADVYDKRNSSEINMGPAIIKYTGRAGKADTSEASAEYMAQVRAAMDSENVVWQSGTMGRVDVGGGGTVAKFIARHNIDTVDIGVPVLSMHSPFEIVSKLDVYMTFKAFKAFYKI